VGLQGYISADKKNIFEVVKLLKSALRNHAKTKYNNTVDNLSEFVEIFNKEVPEYVQRLGEKVVFDEAKKLHERGWR
jgi:hypothetical protein